MKTPSLIILGVAILVSACTSGSVQQNADKQGLPSAATATQTAEKPPSTATTICGLASAKNAHPPGLFIYNGQGKTAYKLSEADEAIRNLLKPSNTGAPPRPIFIYLHGRALGLKPGYDQEPGESERDVIPILREKYDPQILMFHWPHHGTGLAYPEEDAKKAGGDLACVMRKLDSAMASAGATHAPLFLFSHSMGSIVLEEALNTSQDIDLGRFHTVAIFASASRANGNASWLSKIKAPNRYVLVSDHDGTLRKLQKLYKFQPLGKCDAHCLMSYPRAEQMTYVDISPLGNAGHPYFVNGKADKIVSPILKGEKLPEGQPGPDKNIILAKP